MDLEGLLSAPLQRQRTAFSNKINANTQIQTATYHSGQLYITIDPILSLTLAAG